jgi:hypothetical protein
MPNWCSNTVRLTHEDPAMIIRASKALQNGTFFNEFVPVPKALSETIASSDTDENLIKSNIEKFGYASWYDFCVNEWGTKWDTECHSVDIYEDHPDTLEAVFDTAWSPPVAFYEKLERMGFEVEAKYYESGMMFAGMYSNGSDDYYELGTMSPEEVERTIPEELDAEFGISDSMYQYQQDNPEE